MADIGLAKGAEERGHARAALDAHSVREAYRRWAGVYDTVFGGVSGFGRRRAVAAVNRRSGPRVLAVGEAPAPQVLRVELEEFSQVFESPQRSVARVRLRATLFEASAPPGQQVRQRTFVAQRPAPSPDAAGGVQALHEATDEVAEAVAQWVRAAP